MSVVWWLLSIACFGVGCLMFYFATGSKESLTCNADWTYSLTQLGLVIMAIVFWSYSYAFFIEGTMWKQY